MIKCKNSKGITLIALVLTIVLVIIVAGVSLRALFGEEGIVRKAQSTNDIQKIAAYTEALELLKSSVRVNTLGLNFDSYMSAASNFSASNMDITDIERISNRTGYITVEDEYEFLIEHIEDNGEIKITYNGKASELPPRITGCGSTSTTNSIIVNASAKRVDEYEFYISTTPTGVEDEANKKATKDTGDYTFGNLIQNTEFYVRIVAKNNIGEDEIRLTISTREMVILAESEIKTTCTPQGWYNGNKVMTARVDTTKDVRGLELQWINSTGMTTEDYENATWNRYDDATGVIAEQNGTISFRISDGTNSTSYTSRPVAKIDKTNPVIKTGPSLIENTTNSMKLSITVQDANSGIGKIEWHLGNQVYIDDIQTLNGEEAGPVTDITRTHTFTGLTQTTQYNFNATVYDVAGNSITSNTVTEGNTTDTVTDLMISVNPQSDTTKWTRSKQIEINASKQNFSYIVYTIDGRDPEINSDGTAKVGTLYNNNNGFTITGNCSIKAKAYDSDKQAGAGAILTINKIDTTKPQVLATTSVTTNTISIKASDEASGIVGYTITETSVEPSSFISCTNTKEFSENISGRIQNKDYYVWVKDEAGNVSTGYKVHTLSIPTGTITISNCEWKGIQDSDKARVKLTTSSDFTIQYSTTPSNTSSWTNIVSATYTGYNYNAGTTIYTRLFDGNNAGDYREYANYTVEKRIHQVVVPTAKTGLIYNGNEQQLINAGSSTTGTIKYRLESGEWKEDASQINAKNVGNYVVSYTVPESTNYHDYSGNLTVGITKVTPTVTAPTAKTGLIYNGNPQILVNAGSTNFGTLQYKVGSGEYSPSVPTGTNAGTYNVYYKVVGDSNINDVSERGPITVTIGTKQVEVPGEGTGTSLAPAAISGLKYNGTAQNLHTAGGTVAGGHWEYKFSSENASQYSTTIRTGTEANPTTGYSVDYKIVIDDPNYNNANDVGSGTITTKIARADIPGTIDVVMNGYNYSSTPNSPSLSTTPAGNGAVTYYYNTNNSTTSGTQWLNMTGTSLNAGTYYMYAIIAQTANYNSKTVGTTAFTIAKIAPTYTAPTAKTGLTYNGSAQQLINAGSVNSGNGTMQYKLSTASNWSSTASSITGTTAGTYTVNWKITEGTNHTEFIPAASGNLTVTIAHTHSYSWVTTTEATCTQAGAEAYTCSVCGDVSNTRTVSAKGHDYQVTSSSSASCNYGGSTTYKCSRCNDTYSTSTPALGHTYTYQARRSTLVRQQANCTTGTQYYYECQRCMAFTTSNWWTDSDALGHDWAAATCTKAKTCNRCGTTSGSALGHDMRHVEVAATCEDAGEAYDVCNRCGYESGGSTIIPLGHNWGSWVTSGSTKTRTCSRCGETETQTASTCSKCNGTGYTSSSSSCTKPGYTYTNATLTWPGSSHHDGCHMKNAPAVYVSTRKWRCKGCDATGYEYVTQTCDYCGYVFKGGSNTKSHYTIMLSNIPCTTCGGTGYVW